MSPQGIARFSSETAADCQVKDKGEQKWSTCVVPSWKK